ncbi:MAG: hypothetical protein QOF57_2305 [Frankiaceae bacterium]|nr:hypothetical protein [Frankiaceae bacterium]
MLVLAVMSATAACGKSAHKNTAGSVPTTTPSASGLPLQTPVPAESNPPGDIPDGLAFIPYANATGRYRFTHPEGWAETARGPNVLFTDKLNGVRATTFAATSAPTTQSAQQNDVPRLQRSVPAFQLRSVKAIRLPAGVGVVIVYRANSDPDPVTGRQYRDEVQEYEIYSGGREVRLDLFGPVGADNVDAYRTMSQSLRIL